MKKKLRMYTLFLLTFQAQQKLQTWLGFCKSFPTINVNNYGKLISASFWHYINSSTC